MPSNIILVLNSGSSSVKYAVFDENLQTLDEGIEAKIGLEGGAKNYDEALEKIFQKISQSGKIKNLSEIKAVGHRVVHGGEDFRNPTLIDNQVLEKLKKYSQLAPLHNPPNILGIEASQKLLPKIPNIAVFDTAFYSSLPQEAYLYALPYEFYQKEKIRRYGFHGISHQYVSQTAEEILKKKIKRMITCHLGAGSSITAILNGKPVDTSMGFTPLEGLVMETRTGNIDPAIPLYLNLTLNYQPQEIDEILNKKSGFLGLCGKKDFKEILESNDPMCKLTYQIYLRSIIKYIGAYSALLNGLDVLVFTAGIGENAVKLRQDVVSSLSFLKASLDEEANSQSKTIISSPKSKIKILVIPTKEALMIARESLKFI